MPIFIFSSGTERDIYECLRRVVFHYDHPYDIKGIMQEFPRIYRNTLERQAKQKLNFCTDILSGILYGFLGEDRLFYDLFGRFFEKRKYFFIKINDGESCSNFLNFLLVYALRYLRNMTGSLVTLVSGKTLVYKGYNPTVPSLQQGKNGGARHIVEDKAARVNGFEQTPTILHNTKILNEVNWGKFLVLCAMERWKAFSKHCYVLISSTVQGGQSLAIPGGTTNG